MKPTTSLVVMCMISLFAGTSACKQRSGSLSSTRNQTLNHGVPQIVTLTSDQHALEILSRGPDQSVGILYLAHDNHLYDFSDLSTLMGRAKGNA